MMLCQQEFSFNLSFEGKKEGKKKGKKEEKRVIRGQKWTRHKSQKSNKTLVNILAVHGWMDNSSSFEPLAKKLCLAYDNLSFLAIDLLGHGQSDHKSSYEFYYYSDWLYELGQVIDCLNSYQYNDQSKIILLGHSLGASLCLLYSSLFPEKIHKLILVDALGPPPLETLSTPSSHSPLPMRLKASISERNKTTPYRFDNLEHAAKVKSRLAKISIENASLIMNRSLKKIDDHIDRDKNKDKTSSHFELTTDLKVKMKSIHYFTQKDIESILKNFQIPCLLLLAQSTASSTYFDFYKPLTMKMKTLKIIDGFSGHYLHMEEVSRVSEEIDRFLNF